MSKKSAASAPAASRWPDAARRHGCPRLISHGALLCADARRRTRDTVDDSDISPAPRAPPLNPFLDSGAQNWAQYLQISLCGCPFGPARQDKRTEACAAPTRTESLSGWLRAATQRVFPDQNRNARPGFAASENKRRCAGPSL